MRNFLLGFLTSTTAFMGLVVIGCAYERERIIEDKKTVLKLAHGIADLTKVALEQKNKD